MKKDKVPPVTVDLWLVKALRVVKTHNMSFECFREEVCSTSGYKVPAWPPLKNVPLVVARQPPTGFYLFLNLCNNMVLPPRFLNLIDMYRRVP